MFDLPSFHKLLSTRQLGRCLIYLSSVDSTMVGMKNLLTCIPNVYSGTTLLAEFQTHGHGRAGRSWNSEEGKNLLFTTVISFDYLRSCTQETLSDWELMVKCNLAASISLCKALEDMGISSAGVKWPNDVWIRGKKISGLLINADTETVHLGVGINVLQNMPMASDPVVSRTGTCVSAELSNVFQENIQLRETVLALFFNHYESLLCLSHSNILEAYKKYDLLLGNSIVVMPKRMEDVSSHYVAIAAGISPNGLLLVRRENDTRIIELSGEEVSIRPFLDQVFPPT